MGGPVLCGVVKWSGLRSIQGEASVQNICMPGPSLGRAEAVETKAARPPFHVLQILC